MNEYCARNLRKNVQESRHERESPASFWEGRNYRRLRKKMLAGMRLYIEKTEGLSDKVRGEDHSQVLSGRTREYVRDISLSDNEAADPATVMRKMGLTHLWGAY